MTASTILSSARGTMAPKFTPSGWNKGKGKARQWILDNIGHQGEDCLTWPFCSMPAGYGQLGYLGKMHYAHRMMCEQAHGTPPTPKHEAAHLCGNGHRGCVNPRHLAWKTKKENRADCIEHGTNVRSHSGRYGKLSDDQVQQIRALRGKERQVDVAARFGISYQSVGMIQRGKMYPRVPNQAPQS